MPKKHIVFITTNNLPTNPRLLKEVDVALHEYRVTVILFMLGNWSEPLNKREMDKRPGVNFIQLDATRATSLSWFTWGVMEKLARLIYPLFKRSLFINALTHTRRSLQLLQALQKVNSCDLIIGHNLGTLYPIHQYSKNKCIPFVYDIEDYDPGIHVPEGGKHYQSCTEYLLKKCAPLAQALTSASPLIGEYTLKLMGGHPNHQVILNSFPLNEFVHPSYQKINSSTNQLRLVWFSQNISFGRGLEQFFEALLWLPNDTNQQIDITLIGNLDSKFDKEVIQPLLAKLSNLTSQISLLVSPPLPQSDLHAELARHDIGLALEFDETDLNRQLCLTNKIIVYAQAGLYILATDTLGQTDFLKQYPNVGQTCGQNAHGIMNGLLSLLSNINSIKNDASNRFERGKELSWEDESQKIINTIWKKTI